MALNRTDLAAGMTGVGMLHQHAPTTLRTIRAFLQEATGGEFDYDEVAVALSKAQNLAWLADSLGSADHDEERLTIRRMNRAEKELAESCGRVLREGRP